MTIASNTVEIDPRLIAEAQRLGIDVTAAVAADLSARIDAARRRAQWREENRAAIQSANDELAQRGLWSDGLRVF